MVKMYALREPPLLALLSIIIAVVAATSSCDCYETDTEDYFTDYQFYDFRTITPVLNVPPLPSALPTDLQPTPSDYASQPDIGNQQAGWVQSNAWTGHWETMSWGKLPSDGFPTRMQNSLANVYIADSNVDANSTSKLVLRTHRFQGFQSSAEVESNQKNLFYASIRIRVRVEGAPGAVAGLFIYSNSQNESDIEILTRDKINEIRYSNQPVIDDASNEIQGASTSVNMSTGAELDGSLDPDARRLKPRGDKYGDVKWDDWHTHRIDWTEGKSSWFVDGVHYLDKTYGVPTLPSYLVMNMWSDGGVWSGNMTVGNSAYMEIEYVEMVFNTSGANPTKTRRSNDKCGVVCVVDDIKVVGQPEEKAAAASVMVQYSLLFCGVVLAMAGVGIL